MDNGHLAHVAHQLVDAMDKQADNLLPYRIADIVKLHSKLAVGSAWIPVPGADIAASAATIWTMYGRINSALGLSLKENLGKTIASGVVTNLASYFAVAGFGSIIKVLPGIGTVGGAVLMSATLYASTIASGWVYLKALCLLAETYGSQIDMSQLGNAVQTVLTDSASIKKVIKEAKNDYKR